MRLPWPHRDGGDDAAPAAASPESTGRLADRLHREVEDLRDELTDDLLLALLLLGEDEGEEAVGLLDLGSDRLHRFQDRVEDAVADAAVEREAEQVLAEASAACVGTGPSGVRGTARRIRVLASIAAAALAVLVALVSVEPSGDPRLVAARASSQPAATVPSVPALPAGSPAEGAGGSTESDEAGEPVSPSAVTPDGRLDTLRAMDDGGDVLAFLGSEPRRSIVAALFGVDRLAGEVVADAGDVLPSETVDAVAETASELEVPIDPSSPDPSPEPEPTTDASPSEDPGTDPAADGPDAEDPGEEPTEETSSEPDGASDEPSEEDADDMDGSFPSGTDDATSTDGSGVV